MNLSELLARVEVAIGIQGPPRALREVLEQEMRGHFQLLPIRAAEEAERMEKRVRKRITEKQQEMEEAGTISVVIIHYANQRRVVGSCWVGPSDTQVVAAAKQGRVHVQQILAALRALTADQFERFGSRILRELGAERVQVTRRSGDNGVDFYGFLSLGGIMQQPPAICQLAHNIQLLFVGQAKHYYSAARKFLKWMVGGCAVGAEGLKGVPRIRRERGGERVERWVFKMGASLAMTEVMQTIYPTSLTPEEYVEQEFHKQVRPPENCPNCQRACVLEALAYYERYITTATALVLMIWVRRFLCRLCRVSVSCLPAFAQPYRLVNTPTIAAGFNGQNVRPEVQRWSQLIKVYWRQFETHLPVLLRQVGNAFGPVPLQPAAPGFWRQLLRACDDLAGATRQLVHQFHTCLFGTYRCHQRRPLQAA